MEIDLLELISGTLLLVLNSLSPVEVSLSDKECCNFQDSTCCKIICSDFSDLLVGCIYRSPSSPSQNNLNLNKLLSCLCNLSDSLKIIVGDFNFPDVNWDLFLVSQLLNLFVILSMIVI